MPQQRNDPPQLVGHLLLTLVGASWGECQACDRHGGCYRVVPTLMPNQTAELRCCRACFNRVARSTNEPSVRKFLTLAVDDAVKAGMRLAVLAEEQRQKSRAAGWEESVALLVRLLGLPLAVENKIALMKAVRGLTGVGLAEVKDLVERGMTHVQRPLELPDAIHAAKNGHVAAGAVP